MINITKIAFAVIFLFFVRDIGAYYPGLLSTPEAQAISAVNARRLADPVLNPYVAPGVY